MRLRVVSYNIHKGFTPGNADFVLARIKESIRAIDADVVFLQEVLGQHDEHAANVPDWPLVSQFEFLADQAWPHYAYGRNAVYTEGHHGNAILSRFPIIEWDNEDVSLTKFERRGLLHARVEVPGSSAAVELVCLHLNLFERHRKEQLDRLVARMQRMVPSHSPLVIAGDFNDWRELASSKLAQELGVNEVFKEKHGGYARTYPSWFPWFRLDRIYVRGFEIRSAKVLNSRAWRELSDHLPISAELGLAETAAARYKNPTR